MHVAVFADTEGAFGVGLIVGDSGRRKADMIQNY